MRQRSWRRYRLLSLLICWFCGMLSPAVAFDLATDPTPVIMAQAPSVSELEQQAQSFYQNQQYRQAIAPLQQAHQQYQQQGEATAAAVALSNLSLTYQAVGAWDEATAAVDQAIVLLHLSSSPPAPASVVAQVLDVQGKLQFDRGEVNAALATWQHTAELYQDLGDIQRLALSYINQAQALQALGLYRRVLAVLSDLQGQLADQPDSTTRVVALRALGDALRATGNLDVAAGVLSESRAIAAQLQQPELVATVNLSLGNLERSRQATLSPAEETRQDHIDQALSYYQQAANSGDRALRIQSQLNQLSLLTSPQVQRWDAAQSLYPQVQSQIGQLPPGRSAIFAQVNLAQSLIALKQGSSAATPSWQTIAQILATAQQQATDLEDPRARSFVLGNLGHLYELTQQWAIALDLTRQALALAQSINAEDISYRWQWQLGRIFKGEMTAAIATAAYPKAAQNLQAATQAYKNAFETLQNLRSDLVTANSDLRFSFRESVEPVYRQLVDLLLTPDPATLKANSAISQENLRAARDVMEALQIAELENFFQAACIESTLKIDQAVSSKDPTAAVLYPIILSDRLEVILKLPQTADLIHYTTFINKADVDSELHQLRANLERLPAIAAARRGGKRVYDWLISPVEGQLKAAKIKTLIFVLEGALRSVPMPALYDGEQYLVEKYATDLILGLEIRNPEVLPPPQQLRVLAAGLTNPPLGVGNYSPLANVNSELDKIGAAKVPATFIRDQAFTLSKFNQVLNQANYDIVHLATHGQFGADQENTFILAANGKITILELDQLFRGEQQVSDRPIQILVLSACRTAAGDDRAVLGIAGTAVRASARSAIASLWSLDDESSVLFAETLYQNLGQPGVSRAEALRRAQVALLQEYRFPLFWAPYVLVGSWL